MTKLSPNERLLIESGVNRYKLVGPGWVWLKPWHQTLTTLYVGPQGTSLKFEEVRTADNIPLQVSVQILHRVDPDLLTDALLPKLPGLNEGGWQNILRWRTEHILRQMLAAYPWRDLGRQAVHQRLERQLTHTLTGYLKVVGLNVDAVCLVRVELPGQLQHTIIQAERDNLEPRGRARVLKEYFDIFGHDLVQAMPCIVQWELLNILRKQGNSHVLLTSAGLSPGQEASGRQPLYQMQLPLPQDH